METAMQIKNRMATFIGLAIALLVSPFFIASYRLLTGENHSDQQILLRELGIFLIAALLLWIVRRKEALPWSSVGWNTIDLLKSLLRGLGLTVLVLAVTVGLYLLLKRLGFHLGEERSNAFHPALFVTTLIVLRAGITEELFYRGYAIERLQSLTGRKWIAALVPLALFSVAHYRQGLGGIVAAFVIGAIFTAFYVRYRDLLANITAHFFSDFVLNVVLPIVSSG
jgi:uncharacterized protein